METLLLGSTDLHTPLSSIGKQVSIRSRNDLCTSIRSRLCNICWTEKWNHYTTFECNTPS